MPATTTHPGWTYRSVFATDGSFPRDSLIDGAVAPDTFGLSEIDEDAYPLLMAWEGGFAGDAAFYRSHIRPAADFVVSHGPAYGVERWEEHPGYSPSTLAAGIAGLVAASRLAAAAGDTARASLYAATGILLMRRATTWATAACRGSTSGG